MFDNLFLIKDKINFPLKTGSGALPFDEKNDELSRLNLLGDLVILNLKLVS